MQWRINFWLLMISVCNLATRKAEDAVGWHFIRLHRCYNSINSDHLLFVLPVFVLYLYFWGLHVYYTLPTLPTSYHICICVFTLVSISTKLVLYLYWSPPHCPLSSAALWSLAPFWWQQPAQQKRDDDLKQIQDQLQGLLVIGGRGCAWCFKWFRELQRFDKVPDQWSYVRYERLKIDLRSTGNDSTNVVCISIPVRLTKMYDIFRMKRWVQSIGKQFVFPLFR